jgi:hypothetical protein
VAFFFHSCPASQGKKGAKNPHSEAVEKRKKTSGFATPFKPREG